MKVNFVLQHHELVKEKGNPEVVDPYLFVYLQPLMLTCQAFAFQMVQIPLNCHFESKNE